MSPSRSMAPSMEGRLRTIVAATKINWRAPKEYDHFANITMDNGDASINMPQGYDSYYTLMKLFHELGHKAAPGELSAFGDWEEDILERVVEPRLMEYVLRRPRKHQWWLAFMRESGWIPPKRKGAK